jgi:hypothetical protein
MTVVMVAVHVVDADGGGCEAWEVHPALDRRTEKHSGSNAVVPARRGY